nr:hypothetical protein [Tanacetum cinerariifolium]
MHDSKESDDIQEDSDYESMPKDDLRSVSEFEAADFNDKQGNDVSHSNYIFLDNNAFVKRLSLPDHMDHICEEVISLYSNLGDMESSIIHQVSAEIKSTLPALVTTALQEQSLLESAVIVDDTAKGEKNKKAKDANPVATQGEHQSTEPLVEKSKSKISVVINQAKRLGLLSPPELATFELTAEDKKRKKTSVIKEVFVKERIEVDGIQRNLTPPSGVVGKKGLVIREPEAGFFYFNANFNLVFQRESEFYITNIVQLIRLQKHIVLDSLEAKEMYKIMDIEIESKDDVNKGREIVRTNSDELGI